jgi:nucleoside-diphosphate-sugar epimerase
MEHALVTGGAGFIGSHLVRELGKQGIKVRVLDNLSSGRIANLGGLGRKIEFIEGDIRNAVACRNACRGVDVVFHLAAMVSVPQSIVDPVQSDAINIGGTLNLLLSARDHRVRRFVFSSSSAVYGDTQTLPTHEQMLPCPTSPYGVQKLTGEHYARNFTRLYGLETICLRYFNVYGPGQDPQSDYAAAIPAFICRLLAGQAPIIYGDGEQTRDFCSVKDIVSANLLASETNDVDAIGNVFNIASGCRISLNRLLSDIQKAAGSEISPCYEAPRIGDIRHSGADITHARNVLGFVPKVHLATGLKETFAYYRSLPSTG